MKAIISPVKTILTSFKSNVTVRRLETSSQEDVSEVTHPPTDSTSVTTNYYLLFLSVVPPRLNAVTLHPRQSALLTPMINRFTSIGTLNGGGRQQLVPDVIKQRKMFCLISRDEERL